MTRSFIQVVKQDPFPNNELENSSNEYIPATKLESVQNGEDSDIELPTKVSEFFRQHILPNLLLLSSLGEGGDTKEIIENLIMQTNLLINQNPSILK